MKPRSKFTFVMTQHFLGMQVETKGLISRRKVVRMGPLIRCGRFPVRDWGGLRSGDARSATHVCVPVLQRDS